MSYMSYFSMASTHRHRPSQAVEATFIRSGSKSGFVMYCVRICFMTAGGMLSYTQRQNIISSTNSLGLQPLHSMIKFYLVYRLQFEKACQNMHSQAYSTIERSCILH